MKNHNAEKNRHERGGVLFSGNSSTRIFFGMLLVGIAMMAYVTVGCRQEPEVSAKKKGTEKTTDSRRSDVDDAIPGFSFCNRKPAAGRTLVWPRIQTKYGHYQNFLHYWLDRPLLADRSLRPSPWSVNTYPSFRRMIGQMDEYGMDGVAKLIGTPGRMDRYNLVADFTDQAEIPGFSYIPETGVIPELNDKKKLSWQLDYEILMKALKSKTARRINGKVLLTSYSGSLATPEQWKEHLQNLREKVGDTFLFVCSLGAGPGENHSIRREIDLNGGLIPDGMIEKNKAYLRSYLDVCDGIMCSGGHGMRTLDGFDKWFYRELVVKVYAEVLAEPKYKDKLFGLGAQVGYINRFTASTLWENGTKSLRDSLEISLAAKPDFIILPEWNEENECTSIQPTVMRGFSNKRIIRYYMNKIKGLPDAPLPGDDTSVPNLIVSYRYHLKLGEKLSFELLNVPDGGERKKYDVELSLTDPAGKVVKNFPVAQLDSARLHDVTYDVATEDLADYPVLVPVLRVTGYGREPFIVEEGMRHVRLQATWNYNRLCCKQALRDLPKPAKSAFAARRDNGKLVLSGEFDCDEEIASVEVVRNDEEVYAVDRENEYGKPEENLTLFVYYTTLRSKRDFKMNMKIENSEYSLRPLQRADNVMTGYERKGDSVDVTQFAWTNRHGFFLSLPRKNADKAELSFSGNYINARVAVRDVLAQKEWAKTFTDGMRIHVEEYYLLPDLVVPVNSNKAAFTACITEDVAENAVCHLRVVTKSGKTWRSRPVWLGAPDAGKVEYAVSSHMKNKPVATQIDRNRIPDLVYDFSNKYSDVLPTAAGQYWYAELGGGSEYGQPFSREDRFPKDAKTSNPARVVEDGKDCLKFDGIGNYLNFPHCALPRGEFSLEMEIKTTSDKPQLLFVSYGQYPGSLTIWLDKGKIVGRYLARLIPGDEDLWYKTYKMETDLVVPTGKWTKVELVYDLHNFVFKVDGKESNAFSCDRDGFAFGPAVFGGYRRTPMGELGDFNGFTGFIRYFRITHSARSHS
jgi:hypothetical protein